MALEPRLFANGGGFVRSVPALLDLGAGRRRRFPARSIWTAAMLSLGVLHTFHYELHKKVGMFFLILMYPRPRRAKNGVFSTACPVGAAAVG